MTSHQRPYNVVLTSCADVVWWLGGVEKYSWNNKFFFYLGHPALRSLSKKDMSKTSKKESVVLFKWSLYFCSPTHVLIFPSLFMLWEISSVPGEYLSLKILWVKRTSESEIENIVPINDVRFRESRTVWHNKIPFFYKNNFIRTIL